jgi:hypothetical protein
MKKGQIVNNCYNDILVNIMLNNKNKKDDATFYIKENKSNVIKSGSSFTKRIHL